ncbi:MAG: hypothetical protein AB7U41_02385 [Dongiaceae bacterium]
MDELLAAPEAAAEDDGDGDCIRIQTSDPKPVLLYATPEIFQGIEIGGALNGNCAEANFGFNILSVNIAEALQNLTEPTVIAAYGARAWGIVIELANLAKADVVLPKLKGMVIINPFLEGPQWEEALELLEDCPAIPLRVMAATDYGAAVSMAKLSLIWSFFPGADKGGYIGASRHDLSPVQFVDRIWNATEELLLKSTITPAALANLKYRGLLR